MDLSKYKNKQAISLKIIFWHLVSIIFFTNRLMIFSLPKVFILRVFGAKVGEGVVIKTRVVIKRPWLLSLGNNVWLGEGVWIENTGRVDIGNNCCISQEAMIITGSHDYKKEAFDLIVRDVILEDSVWICARAVVCPGIICGGGSVLTAGSVATMDLLSNKIYQGNPAIFKKDR